MHDGEQQQSFPFESSTSSSSLGEPSSHVSSERATRSSATAKSTRNGATTITPIGLAPAQRMLGGADSAAPSMNDAMRMEASELQRTLPIFIEQRLTDPMLAVPRPTTRAECVRGMEARPCPWASCRHHLLIEVATTAPRWDASRERWRDARASTIRLNRSSSGKAGRRPGLASSDAAALVRVWIDDALELLSSMRYSCVLDVAEDYPDGIPYGSIGLLLGVTDKAIEQEVKKPNVVEALQALREYAEPA